MDDDFLHDDDVAHEADSPSSGLSTPRLASPAGGDSELEPFPIVDFSQAPNDECSEPSWIDGVIQYGTVDTLPTMRNQVGDVITLDQAVGEPVRLLIRGQVVAEGTLVREKDRVGIRISRILSTQQSTGQELGKDAIEDAA